MTNKPIKRRTLRTYRVIVAVAGGDLVSERAIEIDGGPGDLDRMIGAAVEEYAASRGITEADIDSIRFRRK
ncbi:MAG: hypothetical protein ACE5EQ_07425 [Phycisphaerae bacterium]